MIGGRLLGQGVYGCTFEPAPACAGGPVFKEIGGLPAVGKVTTDDIRAELTAGQRIMRLPLASQYFALPSQGCTAAMPLIDKDASSCGVVEEARVTGQKLSLLVMPNGGQDLYSWAHNLPLLAANYLRLFKHCLEGMIIFQSAGYVHNDIHMGNILVDSRGVGRYIDFGIAYRPAELRVWKESNLSQTFRPKYLWDAPELHIYRALLSGVRIPVAVAQIKQNIGEYDALEKQFPGRTVLETAMMQFGEGDIAMRQRDGVRFLKERAMAMDCWRLGLLFWLLWSDLVSWRGLAGMSLWDQRATVRHCLAGLTDFDPRKRSTAAAALASLDPNSRFAVAR